MYILSLIQNPITMLAFLVSLVLSISVHEYAHAWTATKFGDDTPRLMGRVTLDPRAHLDPFGSLVFLLVGFGWGKPVEYNPHRLLYRYQELLIALAGPASNLVLAFGFNLLMIASMRGMVPINTSILALASSLNVALAAFNLLPIPPLDGSSIIAYFWPEYRSILGSQMGLIVLLVLLWIPIFGSYTLADIFIQPLIHFFTALTTLYGIL